MKGKLSITRPSYGDDKKKILITIKDTSSRIRFCDIEIDYDKFTKCITGLSEVECDFVTRSLNDVGKTKEQLEMVFKLPTSYYTMGKDRIIFIAKNKIPSGWSCNLFFNSQDSFFNIDGRKYARTTIYRWI